MHGLHLTADLSHCQCDAAWLTDAERLLAWCVQAVQAAVTVDVYVCNFGADHSHKARQLMDALVALFAPEQAHRQALQRGQVSMLFA